MPELLLLDTHVWIWETADDPRLRKPTVRSAIRKARAEGTLRISAMSVWEVAMLESKGRIRLDMDCGRWISEALRRSGVTVVPLSPEIAIASTRLPGEFEWKLADRIIVATARNIGALLVAGDERIKEYAAQGFVHVLPV